MAGAPPLAGFVAKEAALETYVGHTTGWQSAVTLAAIVLGSVLTFAYSARFVWGAFAAKPYSYINHEHVKYCQESADGGRPAALRSKSGK